MSPSSPYEIRSSSSTCAGRPEPRRPATYLTSGAYVRISRSRNFWSCVRRYSCQRLWVSSALIRKTIRRAPENPSAPPQRPGGEAPHPDGEDGGRDRDHDLVARRDRRERGEAEPE